MNEEKFVEEINDIGFTLWEGRFDPECIEELNKWAEENYPPERGHDKNMKWFGWETVKDMTPEEIAEVDWAYYWTDEPKGNHFIDNIIKPDLGKCADAAFGAARRAILLCQKDGFPLPAEKYGQWQEIEMTFNPERMRIR